MAKATDRYEILAELGRGGMGVVYKAKDKMLGRVVALKRVLAKDNRAIIDRFKGEAKSIAALNHQNIIQIFDIGDDEDGIYITTEFVEGSDLSRLLKSKSPLPPKTALKIIVPIMKAMAYAHKKGLIHRDIKPANILLTKNDAPKIADFGLARLDYMKDLEVTGMVMGTQNYASPEQFKDSKHVDHRTDIYSIGALFYEMLTGIRPQFLREDTIPDPFKPVILKAMKAEKSRRYQTLNEMIKDLEAVVKGGKPAAAAKTIAGKGDVEMVHIAAGPFLFGPKNRKANLPAFSIDKYSVTNARFAKVFAGHSYAPEEAEHPIRGVSWRQASEFARRVGKRLPTEAEWEKAARGTDGRHFPWGNQFTPERCNSFEAGNGTTTPVDAYPSGKSPYGVMDMAGNVWEWTSTRHEKMQSFRILKGGAFDGESRYSRCFERFAHHQEGLFQASGFRCVRAAEGL